jgi:hypothetical protein
MGTCVVVQTGPQGLGSSTVQYVLYTVPTGKIYFRSGVNFCQNHPDPRLYRRLLYDYYDKCLSIPVSIKSLFFQSCQRYPGPINQFVIDKRDDMILQAEVVALYVVYPSQIYRDPREKRLNCRGNASDQCGHCSGALCCRPCAD